MSKLVGLLLSLLILFGTVYVGVQYYLEQRVGVTQPAIINIKRGHSLTRVARDFENLGLIKEPRIFSKVGQFYGYANRIKYGEYLIEPGDTYKSLLNKIVSGLNYKHEITFIEGDHLYKYAQNVEDKGLGSKSEFLRLVRDRELIESLLGESLSSLEGYLFPDTYFFTKEDGTRGIVIAMVRRFFEETKKLDFSQQALSRHQIVTLASIIEKETGAPFERSLISSVFHNRLKKKMRLQTDPTIMYGILEKTGREVTNIRKKDILAPTAYNTYVILGLPPGPIANPGIESLRAALNPAQSDYLFFVSRNDGTHVFTSTYSEHKKAVAKFQLNAKMREGKSWRDLEKKSKK